MDEKRQNLFYGNLRGPKFEQKVDKKVRTRMGRKITLWSPELGRKEVWGIGKLSYKTT